MTSANLKAALEALRFVRSDLNAIECRDVVTDEDMRERVSHALVYLNEAMGRLEDELGTAGAGKLEELEKRIEALEKSAPLMSFGGLLLR